MAPDWAFALHNFPGAPLGHCWLKPGAMNCASVGLRITLTGRTSHASEPEKGLSPGLALSRLIPALMALGPGGDLTPEFRLVTVTHARLGEPAAGISPGHGEVWATLRTLTDGPMAALRDAAAALARAEADGLDLALSWQDEFAACTNDPEATAHLAAAIRGLGMPLAEGTLPMRASEDFGRFGAAARSAMVCLGAGEAHPPLHAPDYDFPDALIGPGVRIFSRLVDDLLG